MALSLPTGPARVAHGCGRSRCNDCAGYTLYQASLKRRRDTNQCLIRGHRDASACRWLISRSDRKPTRIADTLARASVTTNIMPRPGPDPPAGTVTEARAARPAAGAAATARARAPVGAPEAKAPRLYHSAPGKGPG